METVNGDDLDYGKDGVIRSSSMKKVVDKRPDIRPLRADEEVNLELDPFELFHHDLQSVKGVFSLADMDINWIELTTICHQIFSRNCEVLGHKHMKQILDGIWDVELVGDSGATVANRLNTLYNMGCLSHVSAFEAVNESHLPNFLKIPVKYLKHWATFKPEILSKLVHEQGVFGDLPRPSDVSTRTLRNILNHDDFKDPNKLLWTILDSSVMSFVATRTSRLGEVYTDFLVHLGERLDDPLRLSVIAVRMEVFVKTLLTENEFYDTKDIVTMLTKMNNCRKSMFQTVLNALQTGLPKDHENWSIVKSILSSWSPEMNEIIKQLEANMKPEIVTAAAGFLVCEDDSESISGGVKLCNRATTTLKFDDFYQLVNETQGLPEDLGQSWLAEFLLLFPASVEELTKHGVLLNTLFERAVNDLSAFLEPYEDEVVRQFNPPTVALKLCSVMLQAGLPAAEDSVSSIHDAIKGRDKLRLTILKFMRGKPDFIPVGFALVRNALDLETIAVITHTSEPRTLEITPPSDTDGFDLNEIIDIVQSKLDIFTNSRTALSYKDAIDQGGPTRILVAQMLDIVNVKLTVPLCPQNQVTKKFSWLAGGWKSGLFTGAGFGKALQSKMKLPYAIDGGFFEVLKDESIAEKYYREASGWETEELLNGKLMQDKKENFAYVVDYLTLLRPECVSLKTIQQDSNMYKGEEDIYKDQRFSWEGVTAEDVLDKYFNPLQDRLIEEFKEFVRGFKEGMSGTFRIEGLKYLPDISYMEAAFNTCSFDHDSVVDAIRTERPCNIQIDSFFSGHKINLLDGIRCFIRALNEKELAKILAITLGAASTKIWPGSIVAHIVESTKWSTGFTWKGEANPIIPSKIFTTKPRAEPYAKGVKDIRPIGSLMTFGDMNSDEGNTHENGDSAEMTEITKKLQETHIEVSPNSGVEVSVEMETEAKVEVEVEDEDVEEVKKRQAYLEGKEKMPKTSPIEDEIPRQPERSPNCFVEEGAEFRNLVLRVVEKQREFLGLGSDAIFVTDNLPEGKFYVCTASTCNKSFSVPISKDSFTQLRSLAILLNLPVSQVYDSQAEMTVQEIRAVPDTTHHSSESDGEGF